MPASLKIFLSYSHIDEAMKTQLDRNLIGLKKSNKIEVWQDRAIMAGDVWDEKISTAILEADIILLLISVDFNNSEYIWDKELKIALERHKKNEVRVIPVILRPSDLTDMPYMNLQALPTGAKPITEFADADIAYTNAAKGIRAVVDYMLQKKAGL